METIVSTALAGIAGALAMVGIMYAIHMSGIAEADMIRAIGSLITKSEDDALFIGTALHLTAGVLFSFIYVGFWSLFPIQGTNTLFLFGVVAGAFHGIVVSFILLSVVAGRHPLERFKNAGIGVAVAHLIGHLAYGAVVGAAAGQFQLRFDFVTRLGAFAP